MLDEEYPSYSYSIEIGNGKGKGKIGIVDNNGRNPIFFPFIFGSL